jgi:beta-lactamase superfamily II metal-dependent hydrolase
MFISGRPTPIYIRAITIDNKSNESITAEIKYKSEKNEVFNINPKSFLKIEREIQQNGYGIIDSIKQYCIKGNNTALLTGDDSDARGVEVRKYVVDEHLQCLRSE